MPKIGMRPIRTAQVTEAARRCIAERGFEATTMRQIAAEAGVSTGTIHHYFHSKEDALVAALLDVARQWEAGLEEVLAAAYNPWQRLLNLVARNIPDSPVRVHSWRIWLEFWAQTSRRPELQAVHENIYRRWRATVAAIVREGVGLGEFQRCDPDAVAAALVALIDGAGVQCILADPEMSPARMRSVCIAFLEGALHAGQDQPVQEFGVTA